MRKAFHINFQHNKAITATVMRVFGHRLIQEPWLVNERIVGHGDIGDSKEENSNSTTKWLYFQ